MLFLRRSILILDQVLNRHIERLERIKTEFSSYKEIKELATINLNMLRGYHMALPNIIGGYRKEQQTLEFLLDFLKYLQNKNRLQLQAFYINFAEQVKNKKITINKEWQRFISLVTHIRHNEDTIGHNEDPSSDEGFLQRQVKALKLMIDIEWAFERMTDSTKIQNWDGNKTDATFEEYLRYSTGASALYDYLHDDHHDLVGQFFTGLSEDVENWMKENMDHSAYQNVATCRKKMNEFLPCSQKQVNLVTEKSPLNPALTAFYGTPNTTVFSSAPQPPSEARSSTLVDVLLDEIFCCFKPTVGK